MTVGVLSRTDAFTRANAVLNGSTMSDGVGTWAGSTNFDIVSNEARVVASASTWIEDSSQTMVDGYVECVYRSGSGHGPAIRMSQAGTGYFLYALGSGAAVRLYLQGTGLLATTSGTVTAGTRFGVAFIGSAYDIYINDAIDVSGTNASIASGKFGFYGEVAGATFDDWKAYTVTSGGGRSAFGGGWMTSHIPKSAFVGAE